MDSFCCWWMYLSLSTFCESSRSSQIRVLISKKIFKVCKNLLIGQIFVIIPYGYACALLGKYTPISMQMTSKLPSGRQMLLETVAVILFDEVTFFYSHWALHSNLFG